MIQIELNQSMFIADSGREFLTHLEEYFQKNYIKRYMYIFLPREAQFCAESVEVHQFGYQDIPDILLRLRTFLSSQQGAQYIKHIVSTTLKPFKHEDEILKRASRHINGSIIANIHETEESLYIPVHAGAMQTGLFYLRGKKDTAALLKNERNIQAICQIFHQRYSEISKQPRNAQTIFTNREREIINWMAKGKSNSVIGQMLKISKHTVDAHLRAIFYKLSVSNRTAAAVKASQLGLLMN